MEVIVIGGNHQNTLSIVRSLAYNYVIHAIIVGCTQKECYVIKSKYISSWSIVESDSHVIEILLSKYKKDNERKIIITCSDGAASVLDCNLDQIKQHFDIFSCQTQGVLTHYLEKQNQVKVATDAALKVPYSIVYVVGDELPNNIIYPCITKPLSSAYMAKRFDIAENRAQLFSIIQSYPSNGQILIQEYIKRDYEIVVDGFSSNRRICIPGYVRKLRDNMGNTSYCVSGSIDDLPKHVVQSIKKLILRIDYQGLFGVELIVAGEDYYFVEINLRNDATTYALCFAGTNLPCLYVESRQSNCIPENCKCKGGITAMTELTDFFNAMKAGVSLKQWFSDLKKSECLYFYDSNDIKPFNYAFFKVLQNKCLRLMNFFTK